MISRMTTVGSLKGYRYNLNRSTYTMNQTMNRVITHRQFTSFAEDPARAARAFQLRWSYLRTSSQYEANDAAIHKYDQAWSALDSVEKDIDTITDDNGFMSILRGLNGADASARNALGQSMAAKAKSIIQTMNGRYSENYIFSGADTLHVPFTWKPRENPDFVAEPDPTNPEHAHAFQYVTANDKLTNNVDEAAEVAMENKSFDQDTTFKIDQQIIAAQQAYDDAVNNQGLTGDDLEPFETALEEALERQNEPEYGKYYAAGGGKIGDENFKPADNPDLVKWGPKENDKYIEGSDKQYVKPDGTFTNTKSEASEVLCYRGIPVDTKDPDELAKLDYYNYDEKKYLDLGLGYEEKDGKVVSSSVFDVALQGTYYLGGYGTKKVEVPVNDDDPNGEKYVFDIPENMASVMNRLSEILLACDPEDGEFASDKDEAEFNILAKKFEDSSALVKQRYVELDTQTSFLKDNGELLIDNCDSLQDQFLGMEDVDPAAAISDFMFAKYCYDTALKVGNSILSQSLMDYMSF